MQGDFEPPLPVATPSSPLNEESPTKRKGCEFISSLRDRLHALPPSADPHQVFGVVREVGIDVDKKMAEAMESLALFDEELPMKVAALQKARRELMGIRESVVEMQTNYKLHCEKVLGLVREHAPELLDQLESLSQKQTELTRLKAIAKGNSLLAECQSAISKSDTPAAISTLLSALSHGSVLRECDEDEGEEYERKLDTVCQELSSFAVSSLSSLLDGMRYPFDEIVDFRSIQTEVESISNGLLLLTMATERIEEGTGASTSTDTLFSRFDKRFRFHFSGDRKTNDLRKPEWYFAQLTAWLHHSLALFECVLRKSYAYANCHLVPADEFVHRISALSVWKTNELLQKDTVLDDAIVFSHLIDECILFEQTRRDLDPAQRGPSSLSPFCVDSIMDKWAQLEQSVCSARVDELLTGEEKWNDRFREQSQADEYRVCECADAMVGLVDDLAKRAEMLPEVRARKRLISLILLLVDDFRTRLAHIARTAESPTTQPFPHVMNASWYLASVFEEWAETSFLSSNDEALSPLHESAKMYRFMWRQMCSELVHSLRVNVVLFLMDYQRENWTPPEAARDPVDGPTPSLCPVLMKLRTAVCSAGEVISPVSFPTVFVDMTKQFVEAFMDDVIVQSSFSSSGASLMSSDVSSYIIPLFRTLSSRFHCEREEKQWMEPLTRITSSLRLLSLPLSDLRTLSQSLNTLPDDVISEKLAGLQMDGLDTETAQRLVTLRTDTVVRNVRF